MARRGNRVQIKLQSTESSYTYHTFKNKSNDPGRIQLKKYDPLVKRHVIFKEGK